MKHQLFIEYYEKGVNISLVPELIRIGESLGLPNVKAYMQDDPQLVEKSTKAVLKADGNAKRRGIGGVPFFEVEGTSEGVSGAMPTAFWEGVFRKILK